MIINFWVCLCIYKIYLIHYCSAPIRGEYTIHFGIRLIDVGISALLSQVGDKLYNKYVETELLELEEFKNYFLTRYM